MPDQTRKPRARLLVAYFSRTGNTKRVAQSLYERLRGVYEVELTEIAPRHARSYLHWLAYSFVPGSEVDVENRPTDLSSYDGVLLGFPKWTFSCPPLNRFIRNLSGLEVPKFFLFMTCGGFDEQRFIHSITRKLISMGCKVIESLTIKRKQVIQARFETYVEACARRVEECLG